MNTIYINILPNKNPSIPGELSARFPLLENKLIELWTLNMIPDKSHTFRLGVNQQVVIPLKNRIHNKNESIDSAYSVNSIESVEVFNCICQEVDSKGNLKLDIIALGICLEQAISKLRNKNTTIIIHDKYREDTLGLLESLKIISNVKFVTSY